MTKSNTWIISRKADILFFLLPVWGCWLVAYFLPDSYLQADVSLAVWVVFVLLIDVGHVWSTIFRTYLDKEEFQNHRKLLISAPLIAFAISLILVSISVSLFWTFLAYLAVYHFVKQQYGYMRIYKAKSQDFRKKWLSDNFAIYFSMGYPLLYWHMNTDRNFNWFVQNDFFSFLQIPNNIELVNTIGISVYFVVLGYWLVEGFLNGETGKRPIAKILWVLTTAGNWMVGIVFYNSDLVFTTTNVIAHGVPYVTLIIYYKLQRRKVTVSKSSSKLKFVGLVIGSIALLAFVEEYLWDILVNRELTDFFGSLIPYEDFMIPSGWQLVFIATLTIPQFTHYIIDGYIWKNNASNPHLKKILLS